MEAPGRVKLLSLMGLDHPELKRPFIVWGIQICDNQAIVATEQIRDLADAEAQVHDLAERIRTSSNINSKQAQELAEYLEDAVDSALGNTASAETASDEYVTWNKLRSEASPDS